MADKPKKASEAENMFTGAPAFSLGNRLMRVIWILVWTILARWTPPPLHAWRVIILRLFGAKIGTGCKIYGSTKIWLPSHLSVGNFATIGPNVRCYNQGHISIGDHAVISQHAYLCASSHAVDDPNFQLIIRPISIGANTWIAADAFVGPGVEIQEGAVLGARGAAFENLRPWTIYQGNPATILKKRKPFKRS